MAVLSGLKFPFSLNGKGGVGLVTQSVQDSSLIDGKLNQILNTGKGERVMENNMFSELDTFVFEPTDASTKTLLEYEIRQVLLKAMPEITVTSVFVYSVGRSIIANISYRENIYNNGAVNTSTVKVGELN